MKVNLVGAAASTFGLQQSLLDLVICCYVLETGDCGSVAQHF